MRLPIVASGFSRTLFFIGRMESRLRTKVLTFLIVGAVATPALHHAQQAVRSDGVIAGVVVDGTTGEPVTGASVRLVKLNPDPVATATEHLARRFDRSRAQETQPTRTTDLNGRFEFTGLVAGSYWGAVDAPGFLSSELGDQKAQFDPGVVAGPTVELAGGERLDSVLTRIWRAGSIRGRVTDQRGEPIVNARVQSFWRAYVGGRPSWIRARLARTDDRGAFELGDLWRGTYLLALEADPTVGRQRTVFHGGSLTAQGGTSLQLAAGEHHESVDLMYTFGLEAAAAAVSLSGRVTGGATKAAAPIVVHLVPEDAVDSLKAFEEMTASVDANGVFAFPKIPPGDYRVQVWQFPPRERVPYLLPGPEPADAVPLPDATTMRFTLAPTWVADERVALDRSIDDLLITLRPAARISGRVVFEGAGPPRERLRWLSVLIRPVSGREYRERSSISALESSPLAEVAADGTFQSIGLPPGPYSLTIERGMDPQLVQWTTASVLVGGREMAGSAFEVGATDVTEVVVTMAPRAVISGIVRDGSGRPVPHASVIVFPRDSQRWGDYQLFFRGRILRVISDRHGTYRAQLIPGEYLVVVPPDTPEFWMDPTYLETLVPSAVSVVVPRGGTGTVDVSASTKR